MEKLETAMDEFLEKIELRCKGWCHSKDETTYQTKLPNIEYFN